MNKPIKGCGEGAMRLLEGYSYPGNVRQLANIMEYSCIVCKGSVIEAADLPEDIRNGSSEGGGRGEGSERLDEFLSRHSLKEIEKRAIEQTLLRNEGRRDRTAESLGISRRGLLNKINEYGLDRS